ncbi:MAG TPA: BMP family protein [Flexilinea sp.]|jgi:basic membrane protein A|nr:BMP family protein [Flexilinea sp.]HPR70023.1 BMP family protein [Flexilinea sp.]
MRFKKILSFAFILLIILIAFTACSKQTPVPTATSIPVESPTVTAVADQTSEKDEKSSGTTKKVALLLTGTINDAGWSESSYKGLMKAKEKYGIETAYTENLALVDMESTARDYAAQGYDIIIFSSADFYQAAISVAPDYPNIRFVIVNGEGAQEPNLANFRPNTPECGFIAGSFAGLITKTNKVGMIGGKMLPPVVDAANGFTAGAKYANPNAEVVTSYIDSWTDIAKGSEATLAMIESGVDVVVSNTGQAALGTIDAAKKKGIYAIGYIEDQHDIAPGTVPFSAIQDIGDLVYASVTSALSDDFKPETVLVGAKDNVIRLSDFYTMGDQPVPDEVIAKMKEIYQGIVDGSLKEQGILPKSGFEK